MTDDYSAYAGIGHNNAEELAEITKLANEQQKAEKKIAVLEDALIIAKNELKEISEKKLPEKMDELGIATFTTTSGATVRVKEAIRVSLPAENKAKGHEWVEKQGAGSIIKTLVVVPFGRNEIEKAKTLTKTLGKEFPVVGLERKIEASTLTAYIKEQLAKGKDIPLDVFSVYRQRMTEVDV